MLDSPPEHLNDEWFTEEKLEVKRRRLNCVDRIREATEQIYGGASLTHPLSDSASTEAQSQQTHSQISSPDSAIEDNTIVDNTPCASNRSVSTTSTEGENTSTEGKLPSPAGPQLRRSTRSTAGKFHTARCDDLFLARVEDYRDHSNYSQMAYLSELQKYWDDGTVNISDTRLYAAKKTRDADNPSFHEAMNGYHQEQHLEAMQI
jgi:hypothetical protein